MFVYLFIFCCSDRKSKTSNIKKRGFILVPNFRGFKTCLLDCVIKASRQQDYAKQEAERERERGGDPGLKPTLRVLLPLARSYHLTFPQHSRTATPAGVQTSKRQSNCAISCSIIYWILGPLSLTTHSVVLRPVVLATLRTSRIFYTQGWHESLHLKQNPKWIICTSSLTSTAVVVQIRAVPTSSGI